MEIEMKIWHTTQIHLATIGFAPNQQQNSGRLASPVQIVQIVICCIDLVTIGGYIFREANGLEKYIESILAFTVVAGVTISFISFVLKNDKMYDNIKLCEMELSYSKQIVADLVNLKISIKK